LKKNPFEKEPIGCSSVPRPTSNDGSITDERAFIRESRAAPVFDTHFETTAGAVFHFPLGQHETQSRSISARLIEITVIGPQLPSKNRGE
jgi:hypothetical protein